LNEITWSICSLNICHTIGHPTHRNTYKYYTANKAKMTNVKKPNQL